jgi:hypothetical protein
MVISRQQIFYETTAELESGEELLLGPREPLQLDVFGESATTSEDRSDRETGEYATSLQTLAWRPVNQLRFSVAYFVSRR